MTKHKGSCHCQKVQFEVTADLSSAIECNCSMCHRKGTVLGFADESTFILLSGADELSNYQFHKHVLDHTFCKHCGVTAFISGKGPDGKMVKAINLRCIEGLDLKSVQIKQVDGKSF